MNDDDDHLQWQPVAGLETLRARANLLAQIRAFFHGRGVLEVETPLVSSATASDPHIPSLTVGDPSSPESPFYLATSPEFAMKRLLTSGSGPIFQIARAFRAGESGRLHNPEFTLLEWYRPGFDHHALIDEVEALVVTLTQWPKFRRITYRALFLDVLGLDPITVKDSQLHARALMSGNRENVELDRDTCLDLLLSHEIVPAMGEAPTFVFDYPASQAALARVSERDPAVAERFELFAGGLELANGFHELTDSQEQRRRFRRDLEDRKRWSLPLVQMDERLLGALDAGMPPSAGVALGIDRLLMLMLGAENIDAVLSFPFSRA